MKKLVIIGAGGHGRETALVAQDAGYTVTGFLDDDKTKHHKIISGFECLGSVEQVKKFPDCLFTIAVGKPITRRKLYERMSPIGVHFATIIHPTAVMLSKNIKLGDGVVIFPNTYISDNVAIGAYSIINVATSISHDTSIGNFVMVNPGSTICGNCSIGDNVEIGAGVTVIQGITIDRNTFVGAGAVLTKPALANALYVGIPAKFKKTLEV